MFLPPTLFRNSDAPRELKHALGAMRTADAQAIRRSRSAGLGFCLLALCFLGCFATGANAGAAGSEPAASQPQVPQDPLERNTPKGTVLGFLIAERKRQDELAVQYLNTNLSGEAAMVLAHQLFAVLDRRLPPKLPNLSEDPEGSLSNPLRPDEDRVGTISGGNGDVDILVERVDRGSSGPVWLFASETLDSVPELYEETNLTSADDVLPHFLVKTRIMGVALYHWLAALVGLPLVYYVVTLLSRLVGHLIGASRRRLFGEPEFTDPEILPMPIRLLILALLIHWTISRVGLSLFARQIWSSTAIVITIAASAWLLILVSGWIEKSVQRLLVRRQITGIAAIVRLVRGVINLLLIVAGVLVILYRFGLNPTAFLTGLGVGGIAIALAAQKTLENIIGGVSLILDRVVHLGDIVVLGADIRGTIEAVSLRSTRIRTFDRTLISVPNGQMANMTLENLSARDKFWFHPILSLRCEATVAQIRTVIDLICRMLEESRDVAPESVRVHFLRFTQASLEVEVFAYVFSANWSQFLEIQEGLLLRVRECIESTGLQIAFPLQPMPACDPTASQRNAPIAKRSP